MTERPLPFIRRALPADAEGISRLYTIAYRPDNGGDPRACYPFPQVLDPAAVARIVTNGQIRWFVAEVGNDIVGSVGAVVNVGADEDRIAECFGLVVDEQWRLQDIGSDLFAHLCRSLTKEGEALFLIAETRTAHPGGWKVVSRFGFAPLGFEPFAHKTPSGAESMLLTGKVLPSALSRRRVDRVTSPAVRHLAEPICEELQASCCPARYDSTANFLPECADPQADFAIEETTDNRAAEPCGQRSSVVGLRRLEGEDPAGRRYRKRCFIAHHDDQPIAIARALWDSFDARLRVLELTVCVPGSESALIRYIAEVIAREQKLTPYSLVVDVRADAIALHRNLQGLGFFPTVYYPALLADGDDRCDAVQFTLLHGFYLDAALDSADLAAWPQAVAVAARVGKSGAKRGA